MIQQPETDARYCKAILDLIYSFKELLYFGAYVYVHVFRDLKYFCKT